MVRRYALACAVVAILAFTVAAAAYQLTPVNCAASCAFKFSFPATSIIGTDSIALQTQQAAAEVTRAGEGDLYSNIAGAVGLTGATLARNTTVVPGGVDYIVTVSDTQPARAANAVNRLCDAYVAHLLDQVNSERQDEVNQLRSQVDAVLQSIDAIQAIPANARTESDNSFLAAEQNALKSDQNLLSVTLSLPPDDIAVVTRSPNGILNDTRSLTKNLLVAVVAALLASFLVILIGEIVRDVRSPSRTR